MNYKLPYKYFRSLTFYLKVFSVEDKDFEEQVNEFQEFIYSSDERMNEVNGMTSLLRMFSSISFGIQQKLEEKDIRPKLMSILYPDYDSPMSEFYE